MDTCRQCWTTLLHRTRNNSYNEQKCCVSIDSHPCHWPRHKLREETQTLIASRFGSKDWRMDSKHGAHTSLAVFLLYPDREQSRWLIFHANSNFHVKVKYLAITADSGAYKAYTYLRWEELTKFVCERCPQMWGALTLANYWMTHHQWVQVERSFQGDNYIAQVRSRSRNWYYSLTVSEADSSICGSRACHGW